jgi:hypothetical protein
LETIFWDGYRCPAEFYINSNTIKTAQQCGYPETDGGVLQMHFEHELGHTYISEAMGLEWSPVLRRVAMGEPWSPNPDRIREENLVLDFQRFLNTRERTPLLDLHFKHTLFNLAVDFRTRFRKPS